MGGRSGTVWPVNTGHSRPQLGGLRKDSRATTTISVIVVPTTGLPHSPSTTLNRICTTIRTCHSPPLMPTQQSFVQPPYDRPTSIDNYPCTDPSPRRRPRATRHEIYLARSPQIQPGQSPARYGQGSSRGSQPSTSRGRVNPFAPTQGITHRSQGPNFRFHECTNPLGINTLQGNHVPERINYTSNPPQHTLKPTASSCSLGQL